MKRSAVMRRTARSARPVALALAVLFFARKWPAGKRRLQFVNAFRAGRKFYRAYPHIAKDIAYGDQSWQKLDVYWPPDPGRGDHLPVILFVHGGAWSWGDKTMYPLIGARFTAQGYVVVIINYSHYPAVTFPAFVEDAAAAMAWTVKHIDAYHGDPDRLFVAGHSSGAHILSLVALDDRYLAAHGLRRDVVRGLICISAPTDLGEEIRYLESHAAQSARGLRAVMGGFDRLPLADPIRHVRSDAPPILILHGDRDQLVPIAVARNFAAALTSAGAQVECVEYERTDHYSILLDGVREKRNRPIRLIGDTINFMNKIQNGTRVDTDKHRSKSHPRDQRSSASKSFRKDDMEKYRRLKEQLAEIGDLNRTVALLNWDQQVNMPPAGAEARAYALGTLSKIAHEMFVADEIGRLIEAAAAEIQGADYDSDEAALVRVAQRDYDQARKLPPEFVAEVAHTSALAHEVWARARAEDKFNDFEPMLAKMFDLARRTAAYLGYTDHIYDALLDQFEPGMHTAQVRAIFADLKQDLVPLVRAISERLDRVDDALLRQEFDEDRQRDFSNSVIQKFGYDFRRGRVDRAVHPFEQNFSIDDVRITTRYDRHFLNTALFGTLHETGHALYELGIDPALERTPLANGTSLGVHESQSRLWENIVGRSRAMWTHFYPRLQATFPAQLGYSGLDTFYRAINKVKPSFIRVEADEVTYNLHIMLRFELEQELLEGKVQVSDLPEVWNARMTEYLGVTPPNDTLGVLQDVHWSGALIGYFATYALGNLISVQLWEKALADVPDIPQQIERGEFGALREWLRQNVHRHGRKYLPDELVRRVTGEGIQSRSYLRYLKAKYGEIYGL